MTIHALIVDDERLGRARIAQLLARHEDIRIAGECKNGEEAVAFINSKKPDLVFLDVQMPDMDGFAVLSEANLAYNPFIVFATAFDRYAIQAFDVHAVDYLLKPFDEERFDASLDRAREQFRMRESSEFNRKLVSLIRDQSSGPEASAEFFELRERGRVTRVEALDILWIHADGNYVKLELADAGHLYRSTMNEIASTLDPKRFLRIHRSCIVNVTHVKKLRHLNRNHEVEFIFQDGRSVTSARSYRDAIQAFLQHSKLLGS